MKAKLLIEPGCEAGSLFCGECSLWEYKKEEYSSEASSKYCKMFPWVNLINDKFDSFNGVQAKRCQPCLDSEVKDEPQV